MVGQTIGQTQLLVVLIASDSGHIIASGVKEQGIQMCLCILY